MPLIEFYPVEIDPLNISGNYRMASFLRKDPYHLKFSLSSSVSVTPISCLASLFYLFFFFFESPTPIIYFLQPLSLNLWPKSRVLDTASYSAIDDGTFPTYFFRKYQLSHKTGGAVFWDCVPCLLASLLSASFFLF